MIIFIEDPSVDVNSVIKFQINRRYLEFLLREKHFPGQRMGGIESLNDLARTATNEEFL